MHSNGGKDGQRDNKKIKRSTIIIWDNKNPILKYKVLHFIFLDSNSIKTSLVGEKELT